MLLGALGERPDGRWSSFRVGLVEPRQNGKGGTLEARQLAGLFLFGERLQTHTAHRFDTSLEHFRRIRSLIDDTDDLRRRVRKIREANGEESIELLGGERLIFKARAKGGGRGFSGDVVYLDEAFWLLDLGSLMPTMSARPNPQLWFTSSAPLPRIESDILRRLCTQGRQAARGERAASRLAYFEWSADLGVDGLDGDELHESLGDRRLWAQANPGLGYRLSEEFIESEWGTMTPEDFARERLGIFPETLDDAGEEAALDEADWQACLRPRSRALDPVVLAFEVSVDRRWAVIAAAGPSTATGTHVEVVDNQRRTSWVVPRLVELARSHKPRAIVCNPAGPAGGLLGECERAGLTVGIRDGDKHRNLTAREYAQACAEAHDAVVAHQLSHLGQPALTRATTAAVKRQTGDTWVFDRRVDTDISPWLAVVVAAWAARRPAPARVAPVVIVT